MKQSNMINEGEETPLPETVRILKSALPKIYDNDVGNRFKSMGISESTKDELTALLDINLTLNYWSGSHYKHNLEVVMSDLRGGKTAQEVRKELHYSTSPNHEIMDSRYKNSYR